MTLDLLALLRRPQIVKIETKRQHYRMTQQQWQEWGSGWIKDCFDWIEVVWPVPWTPAPEAA